jgi:hypothetical protein
MDFQGTWRHIMVKTTQEGRFIYLFCLKNFYESGTPTLEK